MATEYWKRVEELFHAVLQMDPSRRLQFLQTDCAGEDPAVIEEVNSLLSALQSAGDFIETPITPTAFEAFDQQELPFEANEKIGVYKIVKEIGRGGMGAVYLAERADQTYEKHVAIKVLKRGMDTNELLRRFRKERQILASLDHPNIARLLDGGATESGLPYFVMEYVEGSPIDRYCRQHKLSIVQRLHLFQQVCAAISYAHRHLVIHRDIKPSNIVVTADGEPKLLDFGIAKTLDPSVEAGSTVTGIRLMTPEYASPEQAIGHPVTTASDVYALGVVLYELLTGHSPFRFPSRSPIEVARVIQDTQPLLPSNIADRLEDRRRLRGDLDNIVLMAIRKEPQRRYQSVEQLSEDIRKHLEGRPVIARKDTLSYRVSKFAQRNRIAVITAMLVVLSLIAGVIGTTWQAHRARAEQARAEYARAFGDQLRYLESLLLSTYTAPLHDIRPTLKRAGELLKQMERRMKEGGQAAYGSGNNALGNGYLMLKDYQRARIHLQNAWESDYKQPATAYALGKVLGILYQQALADADELAGAEPKQKMIQQAQDHYGKPAIQFLARARANAESPAYVEGLIDLYEKRFDEALKKAADALHSSSRPYEVIKLKGDIYFEIGRQSASKGNVKAAMESFSLASQAYDRAAEIARSDPDIYLANAQRLIRTISEARNDASPIIESALQFCDKAIKINPDGDRPYLFKSSVFFQQGINRMYFTSTDPMGAFRMAIAAAEEASNRKPSPTAYEEASQSYVRIGEYQTSIGADPRSSLKRAIEVSEKSLQLNPNYADAYINMSSAYFYVGEYELEHGENPISSLSKIIEIYEKHIGPPKDSFGSNLLALTYLSVGEYKMKRGLDANPDLNKAIRTYQDGLRINPNAATLYDGLGLAYLDMAKYQIDHGIDPAQSFEQAITQYRQDFKRSEGGYDAFNLGLVYLSRAEYKVRTGQDANSDLDQAAKNFESMLKNHPDVTSSLLQIASIHLLRARDQFVRGSDPMAELKKANLELNKYFATDRSSADAYLAQGKIESVAARSAMKNHRNPDPFVDQAITHLEKSIQLNRQQTEAYLELAAIYRLRSEWLHQNRKVAGKWIEVGLQNTVEAEKINPRKPELFVIRAMLMNLQSREAGDPELAKRADEMLQRALKSNPFLKSEYAANLF